eukprot:6203206-Pleurochrysis_carterae.AAC.2
MHTRVRVVGGKHAQETRGAPQIVHHAVEIQLASAHDHVLARLLNLGREQRVGLVQLAQACARKTTYCPIRTS